MLFRSLNLGCGAEHVQKGRVPPAGYEAPLADCGRACSVDGDADRIVFHYYTQQGEWKLLDGDKIAALCASFVRDEIAVLGLEGLTTAVVQTAYANGAATSYMRSLGLQLPMAKTGVKFLHHEALHYDIAVYFEANGHGTLIFSDKATRALLDAKQQAEEAKAKANATTNATEAEKPEKAEETEPLPTDKESTDGEDAKFKYGTTAMQGWRTNMEVRARTSMLEIGRAHV